MLDDSRGAGLSTPLSTADGAGLRYRRATEAVGKGVDNPCSKRTSFTVSAACR